MFFEHKKTYRMIKGEVPDNEYTVPIGKADVKRNGSDLTIITYGLMVHYALEAAETIAQSDGLQTEVLDLRTVRPLDVDAILDSARKSGKVLIVHEDNLTGGIGGEIAAIIAEHAFEYLDGPIMRLAAPDVPAMPFAATLEEAFMPSPERIVAKLRDLAAY
jgi:2-oxoisovalerate dehydrogenase E1 component beta subunit